MFGTMVVMRIGRVHGVLLGSGRPWQTVLDGQECGYLAGDTTARSGLVQAACVPSWQMVQSVLDAIRSVPPALAYTIIALLVFGESAFFAGFVLPGETAVLLGGFLASQSHLDIVTLIVIVVISAILGDTVGYEVGKHLGPRVLQLGIFAQVPASARQGPGEPAPAGRAGRLPGSMDGLPPGHDAGHRGTQPDAVPRLRVLERPRWHHVGHHVLSRRLLRWPSYEKVASTIGKGAAVVIAVLVIAGLVFWRVRSQAARDGRQRLL